MASVKNRREAAAPFPEGSAWERPGFLLWHATLRWKRFVAAVLAEVELTHVQFVLLAGTLWLEHKGAPPSQRELADHAGTDEMMTSQVLRTLARRGLISRTPDAADARVKRVRTTPEGADLAVRAVKLVESVDAEVFGGTPNKTLVAALRRVAGRNLDGTPVATRAGA
jgi:DNA-binding MarR family transcriptional regulator